MTDYPLHRSLPRFLSLGQSSQETSQQPESVSERSRRHQSEVGQPGAAHVDHLSYSVLCCKPFCVGGDKFNTEWHRGSLCIVSLPPSLPPSLRLPAKVEAADSGESVSAAPATAAASEEKTPLEGASTKYFVGTEVSCSHWPSCQQAVVSLVASTGWGGGARRLGASEGL